MKDDIEIPTEHQKIVLTRIKKSKTLPERMLDWDEASEKLEEELLKISFENNKK
ncbi:hypothetical protein [uncultured Flavobacterium sp.]|uniref:hypothetical protein n=1 Tax=uncultured Flavobacterium sp. TaxID=165435 RepID=UPI00292CE8CF|nr:hypothetical protein [uncultured Flavobacterium sp.]